MSIEFECPDCSREYRVKDELAGRNVTCKDCGSKIAIPDSDPYGDEWDDYDDDPAPTPVRRRPSRKKKSKSGSKKKKATSSSGPLWKKIMGPLALALGVLIAGASVVGIFLGEDRSARGVVSGCVMAGVGLKWLRND